jgi:hypothetical protein
LPVLNRFLEVQGAFEKSANTTIQSPSTILLHICLHSETKDAHFTNVAQFLAGFYSNSDKLKVIDLPFNAAQAETLDKWTANAEELMPTLVGYKHVVVFVTTHSDPDTGYLWLGHDEGNDPSSGTVSEVSTGVFIIFYRY